MRGTLQWFRDACIGQRVPAEPRGKLIITGTGRAGTTLLVRILTRLDLDTGFNVRDLHAVEAEIGRAGLERTINAETAGALPEIVKSPYLTELLERVISNGWFAVDHAIVPFRDLYEAAGSRATVHQKAIDTGLDPKSAPGGLWDVEDPAAQAFELARKFYLMMQALLKYEIPVTFLGFPRYAKDTDYFVRILGPLLHQRYGVSEDRLRKAHAKETNLSFIGAHGP